jgi:hypothetical protein
MTSLRAKLVIGDKDIEGGKKTVGEIEQGGGYVGFFPLYI